MVEVTNLLEAVKGAKYVATDSHGSVTYAVVWYGGTTYNVFAEYPSDPTIREIDVRTVMTSDGIGLPAAEAEAQCYDILESVIEDSEVTA